MRRKSRKPSNLSESLHRRLNSYALAASAAGVATLALAEPAAAKILYTQMHTHANPNGYALPPGSELAYDLLLDYQFGSAGGTLDSWAAKIVVWPRVSTGYRNAAYVFASKGNAFPLKKGVAINKNDAWWGGSHDSSSGPLMAGASGGTHSGHSFLNFSGPWANKGKGVKNRYLGLKFTVNGQTHYGWMRMNLSFAKKQPYIRLLVTGFAWETIPNKGIRAGQTEGNDSVAGGSLGSLAAGSAAMDPSLADENRR